jgi:hypothetical protein
MTSLTRRRACWRLRCARQMPAGPSPCWASAWALRHSWSQWQVQAGGVQQCNDEAARERARPAPHPPPHTRRATPPPTPPPPPPHARARACARARPRVPTRAGTHDILRPYDSDGMAAQLYFTEFAPTSRFFVSWDLDLVFDVLQVREGGGVCARCVWCVRMCARAHAGLCGAAVSWVVHSCCPSTPLHTAAVDHTCTRCGRRR